MNKPVNKDITTLAFAAGMGAIAGMRSMAAPALLSRRLVRTKRPGEWLRRRARFSAVRLLDSRRSATGLTALAAGEMVADKVLVVPRRTKLFPLTGRALSGALVGAVIAARRGGSQPMGALAGAVAAVGASHLAYRLRKGAAEGLGIPDFALALVEDAVVVSAGGRLAAAVE